MRRTSRLRNSRSRSVINKIFALICMIVGGLMVCPFIWFVILGPTTVYMSMAKLVSLVLMVIGGPLWFFGLASMFASQGPGSGNTSQLDLSRIRHAIEADQWNRK